MGQQLESTQAHGRRLAFERGGVLEAECPGLDDIVKNEWIAQAMQAHGHVGAEVHGRRLVLVHGGVLEAEWPGLDDIVKNEWIAQVIQALERQRL